MNELYSIRTVEDEDSLRHYGVLGMKWGVRRNAARAYDKAINKRNKLNSRVEKEYAKLQKRKTKTEGMESAKYRKLRNKQSKYQMKADRYKYGWFSDAKKNQKYQFKADRTKYKADKILQKENKADYKYNKAKIKAEKWQRAMDKTFANVNINSVANSSVTVSGKKKVNALLAS